MNEQLKDRAAYGQNLADLLMLKALRTVTPEVRDLIVTSQALQEKCHAVLPRTEDVGFEELAGVVDKAEQLLIGNTQ